MGRCPLRAVVQPFATFYPPQVVYQENTAKLAVLKIYSDSLKVKNILQKEKIAELQEKKDKAVERNWYLVGVIGLFVAYKLLSSRLL